MANILPGLIKTFLDSNGDPLVGGKLYSYAAGTTTPLATYTDATGLTPNTNPVILDANGEADIWIGQSAYKFVLTDANDVELKTWDGVVLIDAESVTTAKIAPLAVTTAKLADGAVTTIKIDNLAVTTAKLATGAVTTDKINDGSVTSDKLADGSVSSSKLGDSIYSQVFTERNKIINGDLDYWQRGTTFTAIAGINGSIFTADRWRLTKYGTMAIKVEKETVNVPSFASAGLQISNAMKISCTTADTTVDASDLVEVGQPIEGFFFRDLIRKEIVFSFLAYASSTMNFCVALKNTTMATLPGPTKKSYIKNVSITAANTWQKITVSAPAPTDGTWSGDANTCGLNASIVLTAGSSFHTTEGAWQNGDYYGTSAIQNFASSTSNVLYVTNFRLEGGSIPRQFESRHPAIEEFLVKRYCESLVLYFLGFNPNIDSASSFGGVARYLVPKMKFPVTVESSNFTTQTRCSSPVVNQNGAGLLISANLISGTAGQTLLVGTALVSCEIE